ncbi:cytochrome P450 [Ideonella livida]|uniref:Cytochrome P450 n=1 Tax=Ideonella livida TaxID=2707176 RepID=A0A7C9TNP0_9BURK|nr:cytochrome P450 [Ideonella livida]NDY92666.1 cytochrome P450 [Ideonella livida]
MTAKQPPAQHFCPHYPQPAAKRPSLLAMFLRKRRSWLDSLYERSYRMKMGEVHLPGVDVYMVNEPPLVRQVMEQADAFPKHAMLGEALRPLLGDSIFTTNGETWRRQRELMNPSFEAARVKLVFGRMRDAADAMVARLKAVPEGGVHDMEVEMTHVAADIILRTILSRPLESAEALQVFRAFERYQETAPRVMMPAFFGLRWLRPWGQIRRSRQAAAEIRALIEGLIRPRHDAYQAALHQATAAGTPAPTEEGGDILATLLMVRDAKTGQGFSFEELVDQVAMLFLAGHETSASAMSWALHLIANAPDVQERLHAEAARHLPGLGDDPGQLKELALSRNVFRETLRLFPPVGFLARESASTCPMRDKTVKAGASVVISPWLIQRHRELWARPDAFDPDRYAHEEDQQPLSTKESLRKAYLPFGMGPRVCIGAAFALQEAALVLSTVALHVRLAPVPGHVPEPVGRLTIRAENGIALKVHQRA